MDFLNEILSMNAEGEQLAKEASAEESIEGTDIEAADGLSKFASDLDAAGRMMAEGFMTRCHEKVAMGIPAAGGGIEPRSKMEAIADKVAKQKGKTTGEKGGDTSVRAEQHDAMSGAKGEVNKANYRG